MARETIIFEDCRDETYDVIEAHEGFLVCANKKSLFEENHWALDLLWSFAGLQTYELVDQVSYPSNKVEKVVKADSDE